MQKSKAAVTVPATLGSTCKRFRALRDHGDQPRARVDPRELVRRRRGLHRDRRDLEKHGERVCKTLFDTI